MLRLQNGEVIYNNSENLGAVENLKYIGEGFSISLSSGSTVFIPEEDCTTSEQEVFAAYHTYYTGNGGIPPELEVTPTVALPTTEERLSAAEAAIAILMGV